MLLICWSKFPTRHDQSEVLVTRRQYVISATVAQTSFPRENSGDNIEQEVFDAFLGSSRRPPLPTDKKE